MVIYCSRSIYQHVFVKGLESGEPGGNPYKHKETILSFSYINIVIKTFKPFLLINVLCSHVVDQHWNMISEPYIYTQKNVKKQKTKTIK